MLQNLVKITEKYHTDIAGRKKRISPHIQKIKYPNEIDICYYILGKYCFYVLQVIQVFHTNRCKIWPTVLVKGFCKLAAQLVSENSKP